MLIITYDILKCHFISSNIIINSGGYINNKMAHVLTKKFFYQVYKDLYMFVFVYID